MTVNEIMARAIGDNVADGDDIDILETLFSNYEWVDEKQAERMVASAAQAVIKALEANGYAIAKTSPTPAMKQAGSHVLAAWSVNLAGTYDIAHDVWGQMIAAANKP